MNIKGLNKAEILLALWRGSHEQGLSRLGSFDREPTLEECKQEVERPGNYVDYFAGRVIKCNFSTDELDLCGYDRDCGNGAGDKIIAKLKIATAAAINKSEDSD
jgi:hypothetical protein